MGFYNAVQYYLSFGKDFSDFTVGDCLSYDKKEKEELLDPAYYQDITMPNENFDHLISRDFESEEDFRDALEISSEIVFQFNGPDGQTYYRYPDCSLDYI